MHDDIRARILGAITIGGALAACSPAKVEPAPPPTATGEPSSRPAPDPRPTPPSPTPPQPPATATASTTAVDPPPAPTPTVAPTPPVAPAPKCATPETMCVAPNAPGPVVGMVAVAPPVYPRDKDGCIVDYPSDSCAGRQVLSKARFTNRQCCYSICRTPIPPCGRPLLVAGAAVIAAPVARADWSRAASPLPSALARSLADAWLADAALEHASVASFARFALELLALGAPSELVADAHRAALDEVEHASLAYGLAAAYGAAELGPGPLDLGGMELRADLAAVAASAVTEGCIGETFAAVGALQAYAECTDPAVAAVLRRVADDELRHAELAFRFVAWAVRSGGPRVASAVARAFAAGVPEAWSRSPRADDTTWRAAGRLDGTALRAAAETTRSLLEDAARSLATPPAAAAGTPLFC